MAGLAELATRLGRTSQPIKSLAYLITLNPQDDTPTFASSLQYFPDTISDTKAISWQTKEIPGGSLPLYQWTGSGERTISFTAQFTCDIDLYTKVDANTTGTGTGPISERGDYEALKTRIDNTGQLPYNVDIRAAIAWLRSHMLPTYGPEGEPIAPPKMILYMPRSGIGVNGGNMPLFANQPDAIVCIMASCEVTYDKFFPSGLPRIASVSLSFNQVPQYRGKVQFPTAGGIMENMRTGKDGLSMGYKSRYEQYTKTRFDLQKPEIWRAP